MLYNITAMKNVSFLLMKREKEGDLTQSYDKNPYTNRKFENQWTTQKLHQKPRLHNLGRSVGVTTAIQLVWLNRFKLN